jgi:DNA-binding HxlR family transcriptional regulator
MSQPRDDSETPESKNEDIFPSVEAAMEFCSKWRVIVIRNLEDGELRFNELKRTTGASSRTLSRVLDDLVERNLVDRREKEHPPATYYSLTEKGEALNPVFSELDAWAGSWLTGEHL